MYGQDGRLKKKLKINQSVAPLSAKTAWGKVVLYLKEHHEVALHVACGDITDVEFVGNKLVINVYDGMLTTLLSDGKKEIERALRWQGVDREVEINIKQVETNKAEEDIKKLKAVFDEKNIRVSSSQKKVW